jgi:hypothetical protein
MAWEKAKHTDDGCQWKKRTCYKTSPTFLAIDAKKNKNAILQTERGDHPQE